MMIEHNRKYRRIASKLIKTLPEFEHIKAYDIKIAYAASQEEKTKSGGRKVLGRCKKVDKEYKWLLPYDFIIFIYEPNIIELSEKQIEILVYHELRHVGVKEDGEEPSFFVVPHDIEDFKDILQEYGLDWTG